MAKTVKITSINTISGVELPSWDVETQGREIGADCTETVKTQRMLDLFKDTIVMIVDESGLIKNRPMNPVASFLYGSDLHGSIIAGDVLFGVMRGPDILPPENPELLKFFLLDHFRELREVRGGVKTCEKQAGRFE